MSDTLNLFCTQYPEPAFTIEGLDPGELGALLTMLDDYESRGLDDHALALRLREQCLARGLVPLPQHSSRITHHSLLSSAAAEEPILRHEAWVAAQERMNDCMAI